MPDELGLVQHVLEGWGVVGSVRLSAPGPRIGTLFDSEVDFEGLNPDDSPVLMSAPASTLRPPKHSPC
jgi:hypothetical protein